MIDDYLYDNIAFLKYAKKDIERVIFKKKKKFSRRDKKFYALHTCQRNGTTFTTLEGRNILTKTAYN